MKKEICGFSYSNIITLFEAFFSNISSSITIFLMENVVHAYLNIYLIWLVQNYLVVPLK